MIFKIKTTLVIVLGLAALVCFPPAIQAANTVGLITNTGGASEGYTLFAPMRSTTTYLINNDGQMVHSWASNYSPGNAVYLLEDGRLLRTARERSTVFDAGGAGGRVQIMDWEGNLQWEFVYSSDTYLLHHDVAYLPNGNILMIAWEYMTKAEATDAGRSPSLLSDGALWPDKIMEVKPLDEGGYEIVWQWRVWDHLVQDYDSNKPNFGTVAGHPELIDLNYVSGRESADWNHINSVAYNEELDQIILSVHSFNEVWIIDHSTTTEEAAGHSGGRYGKGGDLLYRWGNPQAYGAGSSTDQKLYAQHDAQWIAAGLPGEGDILVFNNGQRRPEGDYSTIDQINPPVDGSGFYSFSGSAYGPDSLTWTYGDQPDQTFFSQNISGAQRMSNGNTLICSGANGTFLEVTSDGDLVWEYINPVGQSGPVSQGEDASGQNPVFKIRRYSPDYSGLAGRDLTPQGAVEQ